MAEYDVAIIGAGHNALVCAGYLAQAGHKVVVLERRSVVGGAVVTEEVVPGYRFDLGGSAHILINHTPIVADLQLEHYGLDYIDLDPLFFAPFPDGSHITIWKDVDRTCESIAQVSPRDAEAYRKFILDWTPLAKQMVELFMVPPTLPNIARHLGYNSIGSAVGLARTTTQALRAYGPMLQSTFDDARVRAMVAWMAAQSGPPPSERLSAPFALWHPMYHVSGMRRPRGGSGMLTQALAAMIEAHGGEIRVDAPVEEVLTSSGRATGVRCVSGETASADVIVSGAHIHTTLGMLPEQDVPASMRRRIQRARIGNGFGMVVRYAMDALPDYSAVPSCGGPGPQHNALQFICPDLEYLERAYDDYRQGRPSRDPALIAMTFSAADSTLAPPGKHTLFLWGQYYPYELASGEHWDEIGEREADRMLDVFAQYAPTVRDDVIDRLVETPLYLERTLGLLRGNVMHLEMSVDQMFAKRPALGLGTYRGPIPGMYLTGASTHPGGGIMGAAGRNAAFVVMHDLSRTLAAR